MPERPLFPDLEQPAPAEPPDPRLDLYARALRVLYQRDLRWRGNFNRYLGWDNARQLRWIGYIERAARAEPPLPMARDLFTMALTLRMTT